MLWQTLRRLFGGHSSASVDIPVETWRRLCAEQPELADLCDEEVERLRQLAGRFLAGRPFYAAGGMDLSDAAQMRIAALAVLPVLGLDLGLSLIHI